MGTMNDNFVKGYTFDGVTGEKTGSNLEDLATRLYPVASSQLVDQATLETYSDAAVTDDAGNAINRIRVKTGGIGTAQLADSGVTGAKLAGDAIFGPEILVPLYGSAALAAAAATLIGSWTAAPSAMANIFDRSVATDWGSATLNTGGAAASVGYYWDLGAVYQGHILAIGDLATTSSMSLTLLMGFSQAAPTSGITVGGSVSGVAAENTALIPFYGRYVGLKWSCGGSCTIQLQRFEVFGRTIA